MENKILHFLDITCYFGHRVTVNSDILWIILASVHNRSVWLNYCALHSSIKQEVTSWNIITEMPFKSKLQVQDCKLILIKVEAFKPKGLI